MKKSIFIALAALSVTFPVSVNASETRCGWITLGMQNMYLKDGEATWIISQRSYVGRPGFFAKGIKNIPSFQNKPKIVRNPEVSHVGYGCTCLEVETDREKRRITMIYGGEALPLNTCRNDPNLPSDPYSSLDQKLNGMQFLLQVVAKT